MTPSKRRRAGREAFDPSCDPMDIQPYKPGSWDQDINLRDWLDGWIEAKEAHEAELKEQNTKFKEQGAVSTIMKYLEYHNGEPVIVDPVNWDLKDLLYVHGYLYAELTFKGICPEDTVNIDDYIEDLCCS